MPTLRERKKRKTNEAIVAEAARLFMSKGFAETTIDEIAAAAEVGVGTLYNYYKSKYELPLKRASSIMSTLINIVASQILSRIFLEAKKCIPEQGKSC